MSSVAFCEMRRRIDRYIRAPKQEKFAIGGDVFLIVDFAARLFECSTLPPNEISVTLDVICGMLDLKDEDLSSPIKLRLAELKQNLESRSAQ